MHKDCHDPFHILQKYPHDRVKTKPTPTASHDVGSILVYISVNVGSILVYTSVNVGSILVYMSATFMTPRLRRFDML